MAKCIQRKEEKKTCLSGMQNEEVLNMDSHGSFRKRPENKNPTQKDNCIWWEKFIPGARKFFLIQHCYIKEQVCPQSTNTNKARMISDHFGLYDGRCPCTNNASCSDDLTGFVRCSRPDNGWLFFVCPAGKHNGDGLLTISRHGDCS